jgi:hypothetical protein
MILEATTLTTSVDRPWRDVYEAIWRPLDFLRWASGLSGSTLEQVGAGWRAQGPEGPVIITFTPHNEFGVMDHTVDVGAGRLVHVPMRVIANGDGAEIMLTLFRQPGMDDAKFAADAEWVRRDLQTLKDLLTPA